MRIARALPGQSAPVLRLVPAVLAIGFACGSPMFFACGRVPDDPGSRVVPPAGVIRGTVVYRGPHPCSRGGHIVGNAIVLVFDRRNPPPPAGLASTAVNFGDVTGDRLFADEPRYPADDLTYCPLEHGIVEVVTKSAEFAIGPLAGGSYQLQAFFDYTGDFLPEFKFRNLPERGDIGGGAVDSAEALASYNVGNPNYQPTFLPVDVGIPDPLSPSGTGPAIPTFRIPSTGFVADNVTVTLGLPLAYTRPYFYPQGEAATADPKTGALAISVAQSSDARPAAPVSGALENPSDLDFMPILTIPQDIQILAAPVDPLPTGAVAHAFESKFPRLRLQWGVPAKDGFGYPELSVGTDSAMPFHMQVAPFSPQDPKGGGFLLWQGAAFDPTTQVYRALQVAEGQKLPLLWPLVVLTKLVDDWVPDSNGNYHTIDPASLDAQGDPKTPVVIMQGITEVASSDPTQPDTLAEMVLKSLTGGLFDATTGRPKIFQQDHVTVLIRPSVICFDSLFDPTQSDKRGTLVAPYLTGDSADVPPVPDRPIVPPDLLTNDDPLRQSVKGLVSGVVAGCLPIGRYALNVVYPDGQAWTVPNEAGGCSGSEGSTDYVHLSCTLKHRPVLYSQGTRAVVEVVPAQDPSNCKPNAKVPPVPPQCLPQP